MLEKIKVLIFRLRIYILGIFCLGLFWDIFLNQSLSDLEVTILVIIWILSIFLFKFAPWVSFILSVVTYGISFVFQFFSKIMIMEKASSWFFIFLLLGIIHSFFKEWKEK